MPIKTRPYDAAKHFADDEAQIDLISDALATGHVGYIAAALGTIAKARGMTAVAGDTGLSRQSLHKALSADGNPTLDTVMKVLDALGLQLEAKVRVAEAA
ncbi:addiction module antidote protein [Sphingomonas bacterium]|uniref:addiction module antidote protein n=1 Tax=Sphingomonas bacterium TaxID=1895847 RepID=UPI0015752F55|nr:addiction module antidote protein [Sphingomonas bacterium]